MIRVEIVLKNQWGNPVDRTASERMLKAELTETVVERAKVDGLELVRIQFLAAPKAKAKR